MAGVGSQGLTASLSRCIAQAQGYVCYNLSLLTPQQGLTLQKQSHLDTKLSLAEFIWIALLGCVTIYFDVATFSYVQISWVQSGCCRKAYMLKLCSCLVCVSDYILRTIMVSLRLEPVIFCLFKYMF